MPEFETSVRVEQTAPPIDDAPTLVQGLTVEEDNELRRLNYLNEIGCLSTYKAERLIELRLRDRRTEIREPRESAEENVKVEGGKLRRWYQFRSQ